MEWEQYHRVRYSQALVVFDFSEYEYRFNSNMSEGTPVEVTSMGTVNEYQTYTVPAKSTLEIKEEMKPFYMDNIYIRAISNPINLWVERKIKKSSPTISGADTNLGDKNARFTITYSVNDEDLDDVLTVKERINGVTIKTRNNAPRNQDFTIEVTEEMLFSHPLHATNTIEIEVDDGQGNVVYRRYTFKRTNTAPKINGEDESLGEKTEGFDVTFSATDQENDTMSAKIFINDKLIETYPSIVSAEEYTYTISKLDFVQLDNKEHHQIRIEVQDHNNATSIRNYTFTRKVDRVFYSFEKETDEMASQILISPTWEIAEGAEGQVLVCNNVYDAEPTWEDATEQILLERHYNFINDAKTDTKWGVGVQVIINKGTATELSYLAGFGGAFK